MGQPTPPSPAPSIGGFLHQPSGMRPSMNTSHPSNGVARGSEFLGYPRLQPRHSSPDEEANIVTRTHTSDYSQKNLDVSLAGYTTGQDPFNSYVPRPGELGYSVRSMPSFRKDEASPPTPSPANLSITTRSGMSISKRSAIPKSTGTKGGRVQKRSRDQKQKYSSSIVGKPLTQIALDMPRLPVADIGTFVHRSAGDRHLETARNRKPGQIKRPMNAFMLYRKAYQEVAKTQCTKNNHQHVSKVCGAGWALESAKVHEEFNEWARIERANHQQAHPGYKFTPSKTRKGKRENETDWGTRRGLPRSTDRRGNPRNVSRLSETPSLTYEPAPGTMGDQSTAAYQEMLGYATPQPSQVLPYYHTVHSSPYDPRTHQYPHAFGELQPTLNSRHSSPNFDYPAAPLHTGSAFLDNYYPEVTVITDPANNVSFPTDRMCDGLPRFNSAMSAAEDFWPHAASAPDTGTAGFGGTSEHDVYLRGTAEDWDVTQLDEHLDEALDGASEFEEWHTMTWISSAVTVTGLVLLAHACYSAQEHSAIASASAQHATAQPLSTHSLPIDISIEALASTLVVCLGLVLGSPKLRPIRWHEWAGKIEREGAAGFRSGGGEVDKDYQGNPFGALETRPGFVDIRKQRRDFADWVKAGSK
ncbi:membrane magnesium transporter-domain-containing protein [Dactylonectria macrodidyma]|uniref:Membrane magnesium transporter-domain-containing protein n=1 Tax=Dactylonectria macrodidyma TaxID=307937 RepID=A0A9P9IZH9_9HYPO|nr:membrane magnesium transporter-domain-containing protein [Dactylonectria macrodidyma]